MEPISPSMISSGYQRTSRIDPISHKAAVYFHQQYGLQEDQGIDLTQSPGRDSPGSSSGSAGSGSRHSTVSLDSGRSSSYLTGSVDRMNHQSDHDMIVNWLMMLNSDEYLPYAGNFSAAGYDLGTIARMTPEDLTAIGITNPHHREVIKAHIDELQINDNLPHFVPVSSETINIRNNNNKQSLRFQIFDVYLSLFGLCHHHTTNNTCFLNICVPFHSQTGFN